VTTILIALAALALTWLLAATALSVWSWWHPKADVVHFARTADGWNLALHEIRPAPGPSPSPRPVILCHGILMSRACWLPPDGVPSVAEALRRRGHHLWIVELRGSGLSHPTSRDVDRWGYGFLEYADHDVAAIAGEVMRRTGASSVDWVGHSMGGLVGYAHLARHGPGSIRKMVTLGSPILLGRAFNRLLAPSIAANFLRWIRSLDLSRLCRVTAPTLLWGGAPWVEQFIHVKEMDRRFAMGLMTWGVQRTSSKLFQDFFERQAASGAIFEKVTSEPPPYPAPPGGLLALYGGRDYMAPARSVVRLPEWFPAAQVESVDPPGGRPFGHLDLLAGPKEVEHVAERIDRFLRGTEVSSSESPRQAESNSPLPARVP